MSDIITLTGVVATEPKSLTTSEGLAITSFRLASAHRRFDRATDKWVDGETNWYTVTAFRQLATNSAVSIKKGERVVVSGKLRIREWKNADRTGTNIDVEAEALGHDLTWGTAAFSRSVVPASYGAETRSEPSTTVDAIDQHGFPSESELSEREPVTTEPSDVPVPF